VETNEITLGTPVLTQLGQTTQATVIGTLSDGVTTLDVTQLYTDYTTSNAAVATVNAAGLVTAAGPGQAFIAAMTDGAVSVAAMEVSLGDPLTTVAGFVALEDGTPVAGADVSLIDQVGTAVSGADGSFSIPGAATTLGPISAAADGVLGGSVYSGSSESVEPVPGGVTDLGVITLLPPVGVLVWDSPGSSTAIVNALVGLGYAVTTSATLPTDLTPYGMIYRGQKPPGPLPPITPVEQAQLKAFVESGRGLHLTGGSNGACCNALNASIETFLSSILVGGSPPIGLTGFSGTLFNPTALQGVTTTPNVLSAFCIPGSCLPGVIGGISTNDPHAFVQGPVTSSVPISGAVWDCGDMLAARGRITLIMASLGFSGSSTLPKLVENMQFFFEGADTCD